MKPMEEYTNYRDRNRDSWDRRTALHLEGRFYDIQAFLRGEYSLPDIDIQLLGDLKGKKVLHLQCHFGMDSLHLASLGADVTGVDFSGDAVEKANELATVRGLDARFVQADVLELKDHLTGEFDIVYTSYGVIGWLPDLKRWAEVVGHFLKPGGRFVMVEFHPVVWMLDNKQQMLEYSYFNVDPIIETLPATYGNKEQKEDLDTITWNHALSDTIQNLIDTGLHINHFSEYDYSPYDCFENIIEVAKDRYQIKGMEGVLPMIFTIVASKP